MRVVAAAAPLSAASCLPAHAQSPLLPLTASPIAVVVLIVLVQVLANQGLCIALHGMDSVGPPIIYGGDGAAHIRVQFRLIVFRPFASEVIVAKVKACDATGLLVSVDFFDHIFIPAHELQYPSHLYGRRPHSAAQRGPPRSEGNDAARPAPQQDGVVGDAKLDGGMRSTGDSRSHTRSA